MIWLFRLLLINKNPALFESMLNNNKHRYDVARESKNNEGDLYPYQWKMHWNYGIVVVPYHNLRNIIIFHLLNYKKWNF